MDGNLILNDDTDQISKTGYHPLFLPIIPFFHHSIIPLINCCIPHPVSQDSFHRDKQKKLCCLFLNPVLG